MAFKGGPTGAINSEPIQTKVGTSQTNIFTATSTKVTQGNDGKVNGGLTTLYYSNKPDNYVPAATTKDGGKTWTYLKDSSGKNILGADAINSLKSGALKNNTQAQIVSSSTKASVPKEDQKKLADSLKNKPSTTGETDPNAAAQAKELEAEAGTDNEKTRKKYDLSVQYPEKIQLEYQDCIKFSIVEYKASGLKQESAAGSRIVTVNTGKLSLGDRKILTTITLPIPAGISDSNTVDWQSDSMDEFSKAFGSIAQAGISDGGQGLVKEGGAQADKAKTEVGSLSQVATAKFTEAAIGSANLMQRQFGAMVNPNMELLFNGPGLRTFGFTFRLSPRSQSEAGKVKTIIRYFKQAMSVKRSKSSLLLKSPHTFAISYLSANKQHPYLNKFKECALTSCNVNYTPDGNYATFTDGSMTSYELQLQFQELVPLFDDDYGTDNDNIGF